MQYIATEVLGPMSLVLQPYLCVPASFFIKPSFLLHPLLDRYLDLRKLPMPLQKFLQLVTCQNSRGTGDMICMTNLVGTAFHEPQCGQVTAQTCLIKFQRFFGAFGFSFAIGLSEVAPHPRL